MKKAAQYLLLAFAIGAMGYWAWGKFTGHTPTTESTNASESIPISADAIPSESADPVVVVTYFTTNVRCDSCRMIETLTRSAVEEDFAYELAKGTVRFQTINLDEPQNEHFARDYEMSFKTVVVSEEQTGTVLRWEKRDDVWRLLNEPEAFKAYIASPIQEFLGPQS